MSVLSVHRRKKAEKSNFSENPEKNRKIPKFLIHQKTPGTRRTLGDRRRCGVGLVVGCCGPDRARRRDAAAMRALQGPAGGGRRRLDFSRGDVEAYWPSISI